MKRPWLVFLALVMTLSGAAYSQVPLSPQQIAHASRGATVQIRSLNSEGRVIGAGSGFFISDDGLVVTNFHVVQGAASLEIERDTGEVFDNVYFVTADQRRDTVILKIPVSGVAGLRLGSDEGVEIGSRVFVMGNPLGQTATFSDGLISARRVVDGVELLQVTAPISPGSSGGPAMNEDGEVIGIATMFLQGGQNLNFLVPIHHVPPLVAMGERPQRFSARVLPRAGRPQPAEDSTRSGAAGQTGGVQTSIENSATVEQVARSLTSQLKRAADTLGAKGFVRSHEAGVGALGANQNEDTWLNLTAGHSYALVAVCDDDCTDVDMALLDTDGRAVDKDVDDGDVAFLTYVPSVTGRHWIRVRIAACSAEPCGYAVQVFERQ